MTSTSGASKQKSNNMYSRNGYMLFRNEFNKDNKLSDFNDMNKESSKAWKALSAGEKKQYSDRAKGEKHEKNKGTSTVSFPSRCSINKFSKLVAYVNSDETLKAKVQQLGFGHLLHIQSLRLPREMLVAIMRTYDPPTNQFRIRGKILEIEGEDVSQLLGVPRCGEEVTMNVSDTDPILLQLRKDYGKMKYDDILNVITSGESGDQFEILFMMHMLGTFLAPTSSTTPSMQLLKVLTSTMKGFSQFDWATYIANDLRRELSDYVNATRRNKDCNSYVGGCIYMLLIYFGERFPLGKAVQHVGKSPIQFWTKEKVKEMIYNERNSNSGVLYPTGKDNKAKKDRSESNFVASLDPVLKDLYANLMGIINDGHKKLVASVEDELRKAQTHIERQWKQQVGEEDDGEDSQDGHDYEAQEGHRDGHHDDDGHHGSEARYEDDAYQDDASIGTPINIDESDGESASVGGTNEGEQSKSIVLYPVQHPVQQEGGAQQEDAAPRRSMRAKKPKIKSPWILTKPLKRARKAKEDKEEKEILFDIISGPYTEDERQQILIQIDDEDITREQLQTLGRRNRLSNRVMSVVCKTLMLDMKREGQNQVRRHIFSADQMNLLNIKPVGWKVSEWKQQLLPQYIGYNMCDCDLIMGPMLVAEHWFCMAIDPSTMNFYVLDSMNTKVYLSKNQASNKKKTAGASPQAKAIAKIRERFEDIIQFVNPNHNTKRPRTEDIWPSVPQQPNLQDCGAHVLIWLHNWSPGELMQYDDDELNAYRCNLMWWLVNHELNEAARDALGLLPPPPTGNRGKRRKR